MKRFLAPALAAAVLAGPAAAQTVIEPGYWESTNKVLSPIRTKSVERRCITPADVEKFLQGPGNRHYKCTYPTRSFEDGRIMLKGACVNEKGKKVQVHGEGAYTPTSFNLLATIGFDFAGIPLTGRASTEARRIGDTCPPPGANGK